jgi:GAF domain-containing protein
VSLVPDRRCWAFMALYRDGGRSDFTDDDAAVLAEAGLRVAGGVRRALLLDAASAPAPGSEPPGW